MYAMSQRTIRFLRRCDATMQFYGGKQLMLVVGAKKSLIRSLQRRLAHLQNIRERKSLR